MKELKQIRSIRDAAELRVEAAKEIIDNGPDGTLLSSLSNLIVELERIPQLETFGEAEESENLISEDELVDEIITEIGEVSLEEDIKQETMSETRDEFDGEDEVENEEASFISPLSILGNGLKKKANGLANGAH